VSGLDPNAAFWTGAFANMLLVVGLAWFGALSARAGRLRRHRRSMLTACWLVLLFVVSYGFKLALLGREHLEVWSATDVGILRFHESCVAVMLVAGATALHLARRLGLRDRIAAGAGPADVSASGLRLHRRAGWTCIAAATLGVVSSGVVLIGMYARL
jgi:uncharacterized membrane protein YozB (DUF420 family)